jgi:cellulose synthase/poly-beta-1,6-N-acetylglucosamine synthase-like glycosyltransferase
MTFVNLLMNVFLLIFLIIGLYVNFSNIYFLFITFFGFKKAKKDYEMLEDETRFLILVAAHNEEDVIASTIENLKKIDYDPNLFDLYIVNDNSTDQTGAICQTMGVKHINTDEQLFPREGTGKPAGLQYALRFLGFDDLVNRYDCLLILDADNHVDPWILKELNSQYIQKNKPEAIQTYLDSKNSTNTLSLGYAIGYAYTNRFFQLAKYRLGLPNAIGGTGFIVRMDYLMKHGGFSFRSLTEDLELEMQIVKDNGRVLWNHFARIYDEKPENLKISIKQRTRWAQGHWFVAFTSFPPFMKKLVMEKGRIKVIDQLFYLFSMGRAVNLLIALLGIILWTIFGVILADSTMVFDNMKALSAIIFGSSLFTLGVFIYQYYFCLRYAIKADTKYKFRFIKMTISIVYYGYTYLYAQIIGLFKWRKQNVWVKTKHSKTAIDHKAQK